MSEWNPDANPYDAEIASLQQQLSDCKSSLRAVEAELAKVKARG